MANLQLFITPEKGKRLIARGLISRADVSGALREHTVVIVAGTTNGYLAEEAVRYLGLSGFERNGFIRGILTPPGSATKSPAEPVDMVIEKGQWRRGSTIYDVSETLGPDDLIFKGANAVYAEDHSAGVLVAHPQSGTMAAAAAAVIGRRVTLIHPVGLEKRVIRPVGELAGHANAKEATGLRLYPSPGIAYTELDALYDLYGVRAQLIAAGGIEGYQGGYLLSCDGEEERLADLQAQFG
ncbi:MAG: hypothetical protein IKO80_01320 [Lachnospiraceae bacterium]|nr:hypothetical protein [Lachnospiraceae bacterium]